LGKVECIAIDGLTLFFLSNDHMPEHFHVKKVGAWEIRVYIKLCNKKEGLSYDPKFPPNVTIPSKDQKKILNLVIKNRVALLHEWESKVYVKENL
jgi:hypothetical protein